MEFQKLGPVHSMIRLNIIKKVVFIFGGIVCIVLGIRLFHTYSLQSSVLRYKILEERTVKSRATHKPKVALFWTSFFDVPFWGMTKETYYGKDLKELNCPQTNCAFTHNKNLLSQPHYYDAIIYHSAEAWNLVNLPKTRTSDQVYIMATMESPGEIKHDLNLDNNFYNLTMTYRLDSDIGWFYGETVELLSGLVIAPGTNVQWLEPDSKFYDDDIEAAIKKKTKTAAWFVSHCQVGSKREELAKGLQKHTDVDIYGECGTMTCPKTSHDSCISMLDTTYYFYLAFENTLCHDYVTEKLFNVMNSNIVPIVFSGADMSRFLPPKSYINANDFTTVKQLSNFMKYLIENPYEYMRYFWWKKHYKIVQPQGAPLCAICEKLNEFNFKHKKQVYKNIDSWFYEDACVTPKIKF